LFDDDSIDKEDILDKTIYRNTVKNKSAIIEQPIDSKILFD